MNHVAVCGSFDDLKSRDVRLLEEAAKLGDVSVLLWPDDVAHALDGKAPKFPLAERLYLLQAIRHVHDVRVVEGKLRADALLLNDFRPDVWVVDEKGDNPAKVAFCKANGFVYRVLSSNDLAGFPNPTATAPAAGRKKVIVTGCFDWFHSGHVRFFEEVSQFGDLYVVVGSDANVRLLKGEGHPLFSQDERRYLCGAIRCVTQSLVSTGSGWMDAEPEIQRIKPDIYAVNEDGDRPEKREFCAKHGLQYLVLKRTPKEGLAQRSSTNLRGF